MLGCQIAMSRPSFTLILKNLLFTVVVPGSVAVYVPMYLVGDDRGGFLSLGLAAGLFAIGLCIYLWCLWDFAAFGRGTPAPIDAPKHLVVKGLYRYSRNPMYLGVLSAVAGWLVLSPSPRLAVYFVGVWSVFQLFVVFYEEPRLLELFGAEYSDYKGRVGRWLSLPRRR